MFERDYDQLSKAKSSTSINELNKYLLIGAERGDVDIVKHCLQFGADPSVRVRFGRNALHMAAERGDIEMGKVLVKVPRLNINIGTYHSYTPLHLACNAHNLEFVELLLNNGADVNVPDKLGRTTLHYAVGNKHEEMVASCIKHGAKINAQDDLRNTPLSLAAVDFCSLPMVSLLLRNKANPNLERPLCIPIFLDCVLNINENMDCSDSYKILSLLLKYGVMPNVRDPVTKKNSLHYVAMSGNLELGVFLQTHGTDPFALDCMGRTSLDMARQFNNYPMVLWLEHLLRNKEYVSEKSFTSHDMYF